MPAEVFADKVVIVTGGASGIGRAVGEELAQRGAHVVLADIDGEAAELAAADLAGSGTVRGVRVDVTDAEAVDALVRGTFDEFGSLDFMFNNAGIALFGDVREMSLEHWNQLIAVNLGGVVHGIAAAYPRMIEQGHGHIVNTASAAGLIPVPYNTAYAATKHAVVGLSTSLRIEAERYGVRVSVVCPGVIDTPIVDRMKVLGVTREELLAGSPSLYPVHKCARAMLRGVERNREIIVVTGGAKLVWRLRRLTPSLAASLVRWIARRTPFVK